MTAIVRREPDDLRSRLAELDLEEEDLRDAVRRGHLAFLSCTPNHPPQYPGMSAWAETVCALREVLTPAGWLRSNDNNYATCLARGGERAIAVATGDGATGRADDTPSTNARKGPRTLDAVELNQMRFAFMDEPGPRRPASAPAGGRETWILLIHRTPTEVRCELSLPIAMDESGHVNAWRERILLGSISLDGDPAEAVPTPPQLPDIDVAVRRRT
jgi:AcrR family transcriptional regulator